MAGLLRRLAGLDRGDRITRLLEETDPEAARRFRDATSDAGRYLLARATWSGRPSELLDRAAEVQRSIDLQGVWEETDEWRISTTSTNRIERAGSGYLASTECDGLYAANVTALATAIEAIQVLWGVQRDLFYDLGCASWAGRMQMRPGDPPGTADDEIREPYLVRLSREALAGKAARRPGTEIRRVRVDWLEQEAYEVVVVNGPLSMTCKSPTPGRANEFAGVFEAVQQDILRLLEWS